MKDKFELVLRHYQEHEADTGNITSKKDPDVKVEIVLNDKDELSKEEFEELCNDLYATYKESVAKDNTFDKKVSETISSIKNEKENINEIG